LVFERPAALQAAAPAEERGLGRDDVRLLVSTPSGHLHTHFRNLPDVLRPGDLLVVNNSATLPASLPACGSIGPFTLNLSTRYGPDVWLVEPRWEPGRPGPLPLQPGDRIQVAGQPARLIAPYPRLPALWFVHACGDLREAMARHGSPIRYGYVQTTYPLEAYQTIFATTPGSAEMPSAARPFTQSILVALHERGVSLASITLHTGVSSQEVEAEDIEAQPLYPEPFRVSRATAEAVNAARRDGRRVIAVGTTVMRALESAWDGEQVRPLQGFTRLFIHPGTKIRAISGLLTGFHDSATSHLALLYALAGIGLIREAYQEAIERGYLWHEFGDSHLILIKP
jgi:S-adenosylmethionine:tRNA ribosyltransferase-isomerase